MKKLQLMTVKELLIQEALGSLSEEYRIALCRHKTPKISKGERTCHLCGLKCINKGDEFYLISIGLGINAYNNTMNVCISCSWLSIQTINRIINEYNSKIK